ncbi:DUF624 domain-containing protein [Lapidilactobacillus mulanensis]|uniref:DUF624 domain-containing protein n=1 Tax=Lapidilactobacillus mulanensis TaxID=2485999 RepID=A0ABW4DR12_9LACO
MALFNGRRGDGVTAFCATLLLCATLLYRRYGSNSRIERITHASKKISQLFVDIAYWTPRLVAINFIWLLACLPVITVFRATRTVTLILSEYHHKGVKSQPVWQNYWRTFKLVHRSHDLIGSLLFFIAILDCVFLIQQQQAFMVSGGFALIFALAVFLVVCCWRVLSVTPENNCSWLLAFVIAGKHLPYICLQIGVTIVLIVLAMLAASGFFILLGGSMLVLVNIRLVEYRTHSRKQPIN